MVGEACRTKEQRWALLATGHNNTEVVDTKDLLLGFGHGNLDASQIFDGLVSADMLASDSCSLMGGYRVAVGGCDFEGTIGKINVDIFPEMVLEVFLLFLGGESVEIAGQSR
jgi:hypothetical protein